MNQQLKGNVISLTLLQIGTYLVPLVVLPYLTRVLGVEGFGQIGFATAFTMYFVLVVDWGFNLSSTRAVSVGRYDKSVRSDAFWSTLGARCVLTGASAVILFFLIGLVPKLREQSTLLWLGMLQVLASTLSTSFYYQGIERMGSMALINLGVRLSSIPLILFFVDGSDDVVLAFLIQTGCFLIASLVNLQRLLQSNELAWVRPQLTGLKRTLADGFPLFLSSAGISLYTNSNAVILGFVASDAAVGYFVAGFTLVKAVVGLSGPFAQAVFPRISLMLKDNVSNSAEFLKKILKMQLYLGGALSLGLLIFVPWGVELLYGSSFKSAVGVVAWLALLPLIVCLASTLGTQILVPLGHTRWYSLVLITGGLVNSIFLVPLGYLWAENGAAISVLLTEILIMLAMASGVKNMEPELWKKVFCNK